MMERPFITRFAPSPTGYLHLGHAYAAEQVFGAARQAGGVALLRIEDTDHTRCKPEYEAALIEDLVWLGFDWPQPVRRQSAHMADYAKALQHLISRGLVYRCFRTRREIMAESANAPHHRGDVVLGGPLPTSEEAGRLEAGEPFAWRLWLSACRQTLGKQWDRLGFEADGQWVKADPAREGDAILARKEFPASYHLASVVDDAAQGVTHVIRGEDLADAAHLHVLLQALLDLPTPHYRHHRLILGPDRKRLAKRDRAATLQALRQAGRTPDDVRALLKAAAQA
jgi:glutamyl-Q tRNA(Asp) synthetase